MKEFQYTIKDEIGIHARPAGLLAKEAKNYNSSIEIECNGKKADIKRLIPLMAMGIKKGDMVTVSVDGEDEEGATRKLIDFFETNL